MRRWVARSDATPAVHRWLAHLSRALHPRRQRSEGTLVAVACALYALEGPAPRLLRLEDIRMGSSTGRTRAQTSGGGCRP